MSSSTDTSRPLPLYSNPRERSEVEKRANMFTLLKSLHFLEDIYLTASNVDTSQYEDQCTELIGKIKALENATGFNPKTFADEYDMTVDYALKRLESGIPASQEFGTVKKKINQAAVADTTQLFISTMDLVQMNMLGVDQLQPYLRDLLSHLDKHSHLATDFESKVTARKWLKTCSTMSINDSLSEDQGKQLFHDLDNSFHNFKKSLDSL
ncbi:hypothetical protein GEMRC1_011662 [Eukaryota sp. GEM-RC1]